MLHKELQYNDHEYKSGEIAYEYIHLNIFAYLIKHYEYNFLTVIAKPSELRTDKENKIIMERLKEESYFSPLAHNFKELLAISSKVEHRLVKEQQYVYRINEFAECFYVLIEGYIVLTMPDVDDESDEYENCPPVLTVTELNYKDSIRISGPNRQYTSQSYNLKQKETLLYYAKNPLFGERILRTVHKGYCFGYITVGYINKRGANAIATERSHLVMIRKQFYDMISRAQLKSNLRHKFDFLLGLPLFRYVNKFKIESFVYFIEEITCNYNSVLYRYGEAIKYIYIIEKGEFRLQKRISNPKVQTYNRCQTVGMVRYADFRILYPGEILGDSYSYRKVKYFRERCVCTSQFGSAYRIERHKFFRQLMIPENNLEYIQYFLEAKANRKERLMTTFLKRQTKDEIVTRFLSRTDPKQSRYCRHKSDSFLEAYLSKMATGENFFKTFNKTVTKPFRANRISVNRTHSISTPVDNPNREISVKSDKSKRSISPPAIYSRKRMALMVPRAVQDIVDIVNLEKSYQKLRKPKKDETLFEFDIEKVPHYVRKKYYRLFRKRQKK